jgi:hypothetical protein
LIRAPPSFDRKLSLLASRFGRFIEIVKNRITDSSIGTWLIALVLAGWLVMGSGIELPFCSWEQADSAPAPARVHETKPGLQIDLRVFSLRIHLQLASLDGETV